MKSLLFVMAAILGTTPLYAQATVMGAGYSAPYPIRVAPGQLVTVFVNGIGARLTSRVSATSLPLPYTLAGISVTIDELINPPSLNRKVPILAVGPTDPTFPGTPPSTAVAVSVQIPFGLRTTSFLAPDIPPPAALTVYENEMPVAKIAIAPVPDQIHIATTCDSNLTTPVPGARCRPVIAHGDGSLVSPDHPAHPGELLVLYAFGLGGAPLGVSAGDASPPAAQPLFPSSFLNLESAFLNWPSDRRTVKPEFIGLSPGFAGLYQINFFVPRPPFATSTFDSPTGRVSVTVGGQTSADTASFDVV